MSSMKPMALAARLPSGPAEMVLTRTCAAQRTAWLW
jgi:hypothetical protein